MNAWAGHIIAFIFGTITGASGGYFASKYTDRRREKESQRALRKAFSEVRSLMPDLISEMETDFRASEFLTVREFVVLGSKAGSFNSSRPRAVYYQTEHSNLLGKISILEDKGFIEDVTTANTPIYRLSHSFHSLLLK